MLQFGFLQQHSSGNYSVRLGARRELVSHTARANRSMELSDVAFWRNKLYAVCDFTGATCVLLDGFYIYVVLGLCLKLLVRLHILALSIRSPPISSSPPLPSSPP